jgi:hypothetical protein
MDPALGRPIATHRGTVAAGASQLVKAGVLIGSSVFIFYLISRGVVSAAGLGILRKMAALWLVWAAAYIGVCVVRRLQRVDVHEGGFVRRSLFGSRTVLRDEITGVKMVRVIGRFADYDKVVVSVRRGRKIRMTGIEGGEQCANLLTAMPSSPAPRPDGAASAWGPNGWTPPGRGV